MSNLGEKIKERREQLGFTQEMLANMLGYKSRSTINKIEQGINDITQSKIVEFAKALNTTPAYLMGWESYTKEDVIPYTRGRQIPIIGSIPAGVPVLAAENIEGYEFADVSDNYAYFFLRVKGDSMISARILNGDLVLIKMQSTAENGDIVACLVNGDEATLKKFYKQGENVILQPANPEYRPLVIPCADFESGYARILGVAQRIVVKL